MMREIRVEKAEQLKGDIVVQGSKNTVLPIMAATLLGTGVSVIYNCPMIEDVVVMCQLLECLNVKTRLENHVLTIDTRKARYAVLPCSLTTRLRSSVLLLGPILARWNKVELGVPGGCAIGLRPIDIHLQGFSKMNVDIRVEGCRVIGSADSLQGGEICLRFPSVGATENLIMTAVLAPGKTTLLGVAKEPEIIELCKYLISMGACIEGVGTDTLTINGVAKLMAHDCEIVFDRIVAGTYLLMATAVPSDIRLCGIEDIGYIKNIIKVASELGANIVKYDNVLRVQSVGSIQGGDFVTGIYPQFPTDLLPVLIAVLTKAENPSRVEETIFENRLSIVRELEKTGALFQVEERKVSVKPSGQQTGRVLKATDLRQGAALVVAGLLCKGNTTVTDIAYIERGYEDIVKDLQKVGAKIAYAEGAVSAV